MRNLKGIKKLGVLATVAVFGLASAPAWGGEVSGGFSVDVMSKYVWRGAVSHNRVAVQNNLKLSYKGVTVDFWSDYRTGEGSEMDEVDFSVDYTKSLKLGAGDLSLSGGYIYYDTAPPKTQEVYGGAEYSQTIANVPLSLGVKVYRDIDASSSTYVKSSVGVDYSIKKFTLSPSLTFGYYIDKDVNNQKKTGWNNVELGLDVSFPLVDKFKGHILGAYSIGNEDMGLDNEFYGGVGVSFEF